MYTGIAVDVDARYAQHASGRGARYTRANPPVQLLAKFACRGQSQAASLEYAIKALSAVEKRALVGKTGAQVRKIVLGKTSARAVREKPAPKRQTAP